MRLAAVLFLGLGILLGLRFGLDSPDRPVEPIEPLVRPAHSVRLEIDPSADGRLEDYLVFVAPVDVSIASAPAELSTARRRSFRVFTLEPGEHRVLVTTLAGRTLVDRVMALRPGANQTRLLVPSSTRPPTRTGIAVYAIDPDGLPARLDRVTAWIDHEGRTSRSFLSAGTAQSDGSTLVPIGAQVNRVLTGSSPGRLRLFVECSELGAQVVEVPAPESAVGATGEPVEPAKVGVAFAAPSLPTVIVTGGDGEPLPGELVGRLRMVARLSAHPEAPPWETRVSVRGRARLPALAPGRYSLEVWLDLVPPLAGAVELARLESDLISFDPTVTIALPALHPVTLVESDRSGSAERILFRGETEVCRWGMQPGARLDLHGLPAGAYEVRGGDAARRFRVPDESEVEL